MLYFLPEKILFFYPSGLNGVLLSLLYVAAGTFGYYANTVQQIELIHNLNKNSTPPAIFLLKVKVKVKVKD